MAFTKLDLHQTQYKSGLLAICHKYKRLHGWRHGKLSVHICVHLKIPYKAIHYIYILQLYHVKMTK